MGRGRTQCEETNVVKAESGFVVWQKVYIDTVLSRHEAFGLHETGQCIGRGRCAFASR